MTDDTKAVKTISKCIVNTLNNHSKKIDNKLKEVTLSLAELRQTVNTLNIPSVSNYYTKNELDDILNQIAIRLTNLETRVSDLETRIESLENPTE